MNINATLIGQMITFLIFVGITMKWIWPLFMNVLNERAKKIADGLAASAQGYRDAELAEAQAKQLVDEAKHKAHNIIDEATKRAQHLIEEARLQAQSEGERLIALAQSDIQQEVQMAREQLRKQVVDIAIAGAERILQEKIEQKAANQLMDKLIAELN